MKIALGWLYWIIYQLLSGVVTAVGLVVIAPLAYFRCWEYVDGRNPLFPGRKVLSWKWRYATLLWCNDESGIGGPGRWDAYEWSAIRNSANNMRILPGASYLITGAPKVTHYGSFTVLTDGWRQCVVIGKRKFGWLMNADSQAGWRSWPVIQ